MSLIVAAEGPAERWPDPRRLLDAVRRGDRDALGEAYRRWANLVYGTAYRILTSAADAEDLLQDVFVGLPRALGRYEEQGAFEAWLRRLTVRAALMKRRADGRKREDAIDEAPVAQAPAAAGDPVDRLAIVEAVAALPEDLRIVFILKEIEGYTHAEVGSMLGITSGASGVRLFRAWQLLRARFAQP